MAHTPHTSHLTPHTPHLPPPPPHTQNLFRTAGHSRQADFLKRDFKNEKNRQAAKKNAFVLLGQHRHDMAAAFFILGMCVCVCVLGVCVCVCLVCVCVLGVCVCAWCVCVCLVCGCERERERERIWEWVSGVWGVIEVVCSSERVGGVCA